MDGKHRHKTHSFLQRNVDGVQTKETIILGLCTVHSIKLIYCSLLSQRVCYAQCSSKQSSKSHKRWMECMASGGSGLSPVS